MSAKLARRGDILYVGWLDASPTPGGLARIMLGARDVTTGEAVGQLQLGEGIDNHCGPAIAFDPDGCLHCIVGAHSGDFQYRYADDPASPASWSEPQALGPRDTYPSIVCDPEGTLHLAHREAGDRWQLWYRRKRKAANWEEPTSLAVSPVPGYNHHMHSITVAPDGTLHLTFQFYYSDTGSAADGFARAFVYLRSVDAGDTWLDESGSPAPTPLTIDTMQPFYARPSDTGPEDARKDGAPRPLHDLRAGNHVVDRDGCPWLFATLPGASAGSLWTRRDGAWRAIDLEPLLAPLNLACGRSTSLAADALGRLHLLFATDPDGAETQWYDPRHELFRLALTPTGEKLSLNLLSNVQERSAWLPALEPWSWATSSGGADYAPWYMYTRGDNAGGIGGDNANTVQTTVLLDSLSIS